MMFPDRLLAVTLETEMTISFIGTPQEQMLSGCSPGKKTFSQAGRNDFQERGTSLIILIYQLAQEASRTMATEITSIADRSAHR